jgi:hypothetical protein
MVCFNGENQIQRNIFFQSDFLNGHLSVHRLFRMRSRGSNYIGVSLMLKMVFMKFSMINNVLGILVGNSK